MAGIICAGWDPINEGSIYAISLGGSLVKQKFTLGGSGSSYIYGFCDKHYKKDFTEDECKNYVQTALSLAMARDGSSGGVVRLCVIDKDGARRSVTDDTKLDKFYQVKK